ncbi:hypothetical protein PPYR_12608 [Photinus pyralis]|uniref:Uncharacterized protein n=1 Tax=Photinus pyralis TaxID=7054 RepID=A0A5N4A6V0_PHOPY|nr:uncharacterized protein LOC116177921 [Photinus pyralis]XP_031353122.1 uncharacterized protein LOC116178018 [Photinus pyralis]KAB0792988.1 hypothetical protein PPYR_12608 [Photinus pyralis]
MENQIYNSTQICEFVACATCFGLSTGTILMGYVALHDPLKSTVVALPAAFGVLTLINLLVSTTNEPLLWKFWTPVALLAAMLFYVSTGCLVWTNVATGYYELLLIAYGFTGSVFLFDVVDMARLQCFYKETVPLQHHVSPKLSDKSVQVQIETEDVKSISEQPEHVDDNKCARGETRKFNRRPTPSHGGTFHVSKNIVPLSTMRSEDESDHSCECHPRSIAGPRRSSQAGVRQPLATYQLKCADCECPCNTDEYVYGGQRKKLAAIQRSTSGSRNKYSAGSCPTSNSTSEQHSPVSDNGCECTTSSFATNYTTSSVERTIVFQSFNPNSGSVWSNSWVPGADRPCPILPGSVADCTQPTTINIERCITIKQAGSYVVSPQFKTGTLTRTLPVSRIARRGTQCTQM